MENNRLISMTDFVLSESQCAPISAIQFADRVCNYANFLKKPLTLGMFVPVDESGYVLRDPWATDNDAGTEKEYEQIAYNKAKEAVLFEGFYLEYYQGNFGGSYQVLKDLESGKKLQICIYKSQPNYFIWNYDSIEHLSNKHSGLTLTPTALKTIYG